MASQLHTGSGDNVVNKYIINNSLDIDSIEAIAKELSLFQKVCNCRLG